MRHGTLIAIALTTAIHLGCDAGELNSTDGMAEAAPALRSQDGEPIRPAKADDGYGVPPKLGAIDGFNDPRSIDPEYVVRFDALPLEGRAERIPWTGSYWPKHKGGIAYRWQTDTSHTYDSPTKEEALAMTAEEIALLSPAEKYDLFVGAYEYPMTLRTKAGNSPSEATWTGYCHGWTQAAIHFEEPKPVTVTNPDGIEIPFGAADIKALLTYYQGDVVRTQFSLAEAPYKKAITALGSLCRANNPDTPSCYDSNPGAFHVVLANQVGLRGEAFGIDATATYEKWNHPVHTYSTQELFRRPPDAHSAQGAVTTVGIRSAVTYTVEIEPQWDPAGAAPGAQKTKEYTYTLELDAEGDIVGGQWMLVLENGAAMTLAEVSDYFQTLDENGDGVPDLSKRDAHAQVWAHFDFPDYVWTQEKAEFSPEFVPAVSGYAFVGTTRDTRLAMYRYMARLEDLYEAGLR